MSSRRLIMAANWKMYKTPEQASTYFNHLDQNLKSASGVEVVVFPTALCISAAVQATRETQIEIGGQNIFWCDEGPYTGEISGSMLRAAGATWVLIGHSERRQHFHETDADVLRKAQAALTAGLRPIICVGERLEEHKSGKVEEVLIRQFAGGIAGLTEEEFANVTIAYEPVWAIGTGLAATPEIASDSHQVLRSEVEKRFGEDAAAQVRIIYGGSVKPDNISGLLAKPDIDGALIGGASLDPDTFLAMIDAAAKI
jgi:triosephosphate isomerase (TIM)